MSEKNLSATKNLIQWTRLFVLISQCARLSVRSLILALLTALTRAECTLSATGINGTQTSQKYHFAFTSPFVTSFDVTNFGITCLMVTCCTALQGNVFQCAELSRMQCYIYSGNMLVDRVQMWFRLGLDRVQMGFRQGLDRVQMRFRKIYEYYKLMN